MGTRIPFELSLVVTLAENRTALDESVQPHFTFGFFLSLNNTFDRDDYNLAYTLTVAQLFALTGGFQSGSSTKVRLDDRSRGEGFFCVCVGGGACVVCVDVFVCACLSVIKLNLN